MEMKRLGSRKRPRLAMHRNEWKKSYSFCTLLCFIETTPVITSTREHQITSTAPLYVSRHRCSPSAFYESSPHYKLLSGTTHFCGARRLNAETHQGLWGGQDGSQGQPRPRALDPRGEEGRGRLKVDSSVQTVLLMSSFKCWVENSTLFALRTSVNCGDRVFFLMEHPSSQNAINCPNRYLAE